jgi:predicted RNA polymerase sigma factor
MRTPVARRRRAPSDAAQDRNGRNRCDLAQNESIRSCRPGRAGIRVAIHSAHFRRSHSITTHWRWIEVVVAAILSSVFLEEF